MKKFIAVCILLAATNAFAVRLEPKKDRPLKAVDSPRQEKVWRDARDAFSLPDGSIWVTHSVPARMEPSAIGVTRFGPDGSARVFLVSDWLPKGTIPLGWVGQIYGVALRTDGRVAVSAGWMDRSSGVHNGLLFLRAREDGAYDTEKVIDLPGVVRLVDGPGATTFAVTYDPAKPGSPHLSVFNSDGILIGGLQGTPNLPAAALAQNAFAARVKRIDEKTFALYEPDKEQIFVFTYALDADNHGGTFTGSRFFFIGDDATIDNLRVVDLEPSADGREVVVVRSGNVRGSQGTLLTVYRAPREVKESIFLDRPWNFMIRDHNTDTLQGIVFRNGVMLDAVGMRND